ncbi:peptidase domain-containing ABC transporter [Solibacillus sp. FSL K6-1126]|uniref:peptidase domain-containing ABC transporter n=1 Tax=Solibacillus sp. FSL K6-1126 TaxID=2921463 RepID=UPI0030F8387E
MEQTLDNIPRKRRVPFIEQMQQTECGLSCLAMVLSYYSYEVNLPELRKKTEGGRNGTDLLTLKNLAISYKLDANGKVVPLKLLPSIQLPAILFWNKKHYVVLEKIEIGSATIVDPEIGRLTLKMTEFQENYSGVVLSLFPSKDFTTRKLDKKEKYSYFNQFLNQKKLGIKILVISVLLQLLAVTVPVSIKYIVDNILKGITLNTINVIGIFGILTFLIYYGFTLLHGGLLVKLQNNLDINLMNRFISHLMSLPYKFFEMRTSGDLILRTNSNVIIRQIISNQLITSLINISLIIVLLIYMLSQSVKLTLSVLVIAFLQIGIIALTKTKLKMMTQAELSAQTNTNGFITEAIHGISVIKSLGIEKEMYTDWSELFNKQIISSKNKLLYQNKINALISSLMFLAPLIVAWFGSILVIQKEITIGTLFAFQSLVAIFLTPFTSMATSFSEIIRIGTLLERIRDILGTESEQQLNMKKIEKPKGNISIENLTFGYNDRNEIIKNISFKVSKGQKVAFIGKSGSGKSTLASLLAGLYEPNSGTIKYDDENIQFLDKSHLRKQIGMVLQEDFLFNRTIKENIIMHNKDITLKDVEKACQIAQIHEDILNMPMKYETIISETGTNISGGQRQRIVLARALARNPSILILDEATSALDTLTERKISDMLDVLDCTRIIIAHRLSTIISADKIIIIDEGQILDQGTHEDLLSRSAYYREFYNDKSAELVG